MCVGYYCSKNASCGQVCAATGDCADNPSSCQACIGTICESARACGGNCGSDDWCNKDCPVCGNVATCVSREKWEAQLAAAPDRAAFLAAAEEARAAVRRAHRSDLLRRRPDLAGRI